MTTNSTDSSSSSPKSWSELARKASAEPAPDDLDLRGSLRAHLESTPRERPAPVNVPTLWDDLVALSQLRWMKISLAGGVAVSCGLLAAWFQTLQEVQEFVYFTAPFLI